MQLVFFSPLIWIDTKMLLIGCVGILCVSIILWLLSLANEMKKTIRERHDAIEQITQYAIHHIPQLDKKNPRHEYLRSVSVYLWRAVSYPSHSSNQKKKTP